MNRLKAVLSAMFGSQAMQDHHDPVLGVLRWRPAIERWASDPLSADRPFPLEIARYKRLATPTQDCLQVARDIAANPGRLEQQVRTLLVYEAERRPEHLRPKIVSLSIGRVTLQVGIGEVTGEVLLHGDPPLNNWSIWHANGVPSLVVQHWE